jgi:hypothetical protein
MAVIADIARDRKQRARRQEQNATADLLPRINTDECGWNWQGGPIMQTQMHLDFIREGNCYPSTTTKVEVFSRENS